MFIAIPHTPPQQPPAIVQECKYQIKIQNNTYKCMAESEWQQIEATRIADEAKAMAWAEKHIWWFITIGGLLVLGFLYVLSQ